MVVARGDAEEKLLDELIERGHKNGVKNLRIVRGEELYAMEPNLDRGCTAALFASECGSVTPCKERTTCALFVSCLFSLRVAADEFTIALCENGLFQFNAILYFTIQITFLFDSCRQWRCVGAEFAGGRHRRARRRLVRREAACARAIGQESRRAASCQWAAAIRETTAICQRSAHRRIADRRRSG